MSKLNSRQVRDIGITAAFFAIVGICISVNDTWVVRRPDMIWQELPYLVATFAVTVGIILLRDSQWSLFRVIASLLLGFSNFGCAFWLWMHESHLPALLMGMAGLVFLVDAFKVYRNGRVTHGD